MSNYTVVDAHEDIAFNAISLHRDLLSDISVLRKAAHTPGETRLSPSQSFKEATSDSCLRPSGHLRAEANLGRRAPAITHLMRLTRRLLNSSTTTRHWRS